MPLLRLPPLTWIICLGLSLRLGFILTSHHVYHPDEIYQSLEQSLRLIKGYGILPWDVAAGLRSAWVAGFTGMPLAVLTLFSVADPNTLRLATNLWLVIFSLGLIPAGYLLIFKLTQKRRLALYSAFCLAIWYELIYFSSRALTEVIALDLFALGVLSLYGLKRFNWLSAFFTTFGLLIRLQYFPLALALYYLIFKARHRLPAFGAILFALLLYGLTDSLSLGHAFASLINNVQISFTGGASEIFGIKPVSYYLQALLGSSGGLVLISAAQFFRRQSRPLNYLWLALIIVHFFIPHKEYRFLYGSIPLLLLLASLGLYSRFSSRPFIAYSLVGALSLLGLYQKLPGQKVGYPQPPLLRDPYLTVLTSLYADPHVCGIYHQSRGWVYTGGYVTLGKNIPQFDQSYPATSSAYNVIITQSPINTANYQLTLTTPAYRVAGQTIAPYLLYRRSGECRVGQYSYYRTFPAIETLLTRLKP